MSAVRFFEAKRATNQCRCHSTNTEYFLDFRQRTCNGVNDEAKDISRAMSAENRLVHVVGKIILAGSNLEKALLVRLQ